MSSAAVPNANNPGKSSTAVPSKVGSGVTIDYSLGGFELNDIFRGNEKLSESKREIAVEFLRRSKHIQLERLQCLADGALLGLEQVQDVRLGLAEQGPEVATSGVIIDLLITLLLDSSIPGRAMKAFAQKTMKLGARSAMLKAGDKEIWEDIEGYRKVISVDSRHVDDWLSEELNSRKYLEYAKGYRRITELASNSDVQKDVTAVGKFANKARNVSIATKPLEIEGDTPGVSLLGSVLEFTSANRLLVEFQYHRMETAVRLNFMTCSEARQFFRLAEFEPLDSPMKTIRDRCKLIFEAMIWAGIYRFDQDQGRLTVRGVIAPVPILRDIDERLVDYWLRRFGQDVQSWASNMGDANRRALGLGPIQDWAKVERLQKLSSVQKYFKRLLDDLPQTLQNAKALATTFSPSSQ